MITPFFYSDMEHGGLKPVLMLLTASRMFKHASYGHQSAAVQKRASASVRHSHRPGLLLYSLSRLMIRLNCVAVNAGGRPIPVYIHRSSTL